MAPNSSPPSISITFLGTASAQPSSTRNHSSLALSIGSDIWIFDCGEATQHRLQKSTLKMGKIKKIFITHLHGDHIFGLGPLLASMLNGAGGMVNPDADARVEQAEAVKDEAAVEIYGPLGTRAYVRSVLAYTYTLLDAPYVVHELRFPEDSKDNDHTELPVHPFERPGQNLQQSENGEWLSIWQDQKFTVSAAPILHSVPSVGYVVSESTIPGKIDSKKYVPAIKAAGAPMSLLASLQRGEQVTLPNGEILEGPPRRAGRKIVILGDTYDPSPIVNLAQDADLLVHEATNAHLPEIDLRTKPTDTFESVEERSKSRGHSTPQMAGRFATRIGAKKLVLNHFSSRYRGDEDVSESSRAVMEAIAALAKEEYPGESDVLCARDFMTVEVPLRNETES